LQQLIGTAMESNLANFTNSLPTLRNTFLTWNNFLPNAAPDLITATFKNVQLCTCTNRAMNRFLKQRHNTKFHVTLIHPSQNDT